MRLENTFIHMEFVVVFITLLGGFYLLDGKIERQCGRTDQLYQIYTEQQKNFDQKFYDLLKERK